MPELETDIFKEQINKNIFTSDIQNPQNSRKYLSISDL